MSVNESTVDIAALPWRQAVRWQITRGREIAMDTPEAKRPGFGEGLLARRVHSASAHSNPDHQFDGIADIVRELTHPEGVDPARFDYPRQQAASSIESTPEIGTDIHTVDGTLISITLISRIIGEPFRAPPHRISHVLIFYQESLS